jgi:hypothetical protein
MTRAANESTERVMTMAKSITEIKFATDRNGRRIAQYFQFRGARRWIKLGVEKAEVMLAAGEAIEYDPSL